MNAARGCGLLLLGLIAGSLALHLCHSRRLEALYWEKEKLKVELLETAERFARSEALWADRPEGKICSVEIAIGGESDGYAKLELERLANEITAALIGSAIDELDAELVVALLQRRKLTAEGKDYLVAVNWVVLAPRTLFNLTVSPAPADGSGGSNRLPGGAAVSRPSSSARGSGLTGATSPAHGRRQEPRSR